MTARILALALLVAPLEPGLAQVSFSFGVAVPGIQLGVSVPAYPELQPIPGYPVYYSPYSDLNYFFYDGAYWLFQNDAWYVSTWYDGPWQLVEPAFVPYYVLRVPVRYYRRPPPYFRDYRADAPPRWGDHWGRGWEERHRGWDRWDPRTAPRPAPLPVYQRQYAGARYPRPDDQRVIRTQRYGYRPSEPVTREHFERRAPPSEPAWRGGREHEERGGPPPGRGQEHERRGGEQGRGDRGRHGEEHDRR